MILTIVAADLVNTNAQIFPHSFTTIHLPVCFFWRWEGWLDTQNTDSNLHCACTQLRIEPEPQGGEAL